MTSRASHLTKPFARGRAFFLLAAVSLIAWLAIACDDDGEAVGQATSRPVVTELPNTTPETRDDADGNPPALTVTAGDASILAGQGSFCWAGLCGDAVGVVTPGLALVGQGQPPLVARLPDLPLSEATAAAWRIDERLLCDPDEPGTRACGALRVENGFLAWPFGVLGEGRELPVRVEGDTIRVISSLESGTYVVSLSLAFAGGGDVNYGVLLVLLPAEG